MRSVLAMVLLTAGCAAKAAAPAPADQDPSLHTPRWAFEPWISKDISDTDDTYAFVGGFQDRGIPVGVVVLDSPWETNYNTFRPNPKRYHDFGKLVSDLHQKGVRVVLWITQMMNEQSFDFEPGGDSYPDVPIEYREGQRNNYFVDGGQQYIWWKGKGSGLDFFNPAAVAWWHGLQDPLFDTGFDGWKADFGDSYIRSATVTTSIGPVPHQRYSEEYYRDFYVHGVAKRGNEFTTMVRGWDKSYDFPGRFYAKKEHAPVVWAGDNRRDWVGLIDAIDTMLRSSEAGYAVVGSDIGGYLAHDDQDLSVQIPYDAAVFLRWIALGGVSPFMELHGQANFAPWTVPERTGEIVAAYRYWATLHHEWVPFFYSLSEKGGPILRDQGARSFTIGEAFFAAPIIDASGVRDVSLPAGSRWYDWWKPGTPALEGGTTLRGYDVAHPARIPLFVREGAIVPLTVSSTLTGSAYGRPAGPRRTVLVYPAPHETSFSLLDDDGAQTTITAKPGSLMLSRSGGPTWIRVRLDSRPSAPPSDGAPLPETTAGDRGYGWDEAAHALWLQLPASPGPVTVHF